MVLKLVQMMVKATSLVLAFLVQLTAAPVDGAANDAVIRALADYFDVPKSQIKIIRGTTSRDKVVELL